MTNKYVHQYKVCNIHHYESYMRAATLLGVVDFSSGSGDKMLWQKKSIKCQYILLMVHVSCLTSGGRQVYEHMDFRVFNMSQCLPV